MKMTKGEAIGFLDKCRYWFMPYTSEEDTWNEALDMAIEALSADAVMRDATAEERSSVQKYIDSISTEVVQGEWIRVGHDIYECSLCHQNVMTKDIDCYAYCHRCGAKMHKGGDTE